MPLQQQQQSHVQRVYQETPQLPADPAAILAALSTSRPLAAEWWVGNPPP